MKLAWPNHRLNRGSRRLIQRVFFAFAACFFTVALTIPAMAVAPTSPVNSEISLPGSVQIQETGTLIAQAESTILNFSTPNYAVRVFTPTNSRTPVMNVFKRTAPTQLELNAQPASFVGALNPDGFESYQSFGSRNLRNVVFIASYNRGTRQARLDIIDQATNQRILSENSVGTVTVSNFPSPTDPGLDPSTILRFETLNYAVRVFIDPRDNIRKMNVHYKPTRIDLINGQVAEPAPVSGQPQGCWINYVSNGAFNVGGGAGVTARYVARVNSFGNAMIQVFGPNNETLALEERAGNTPLVFNVPTADWPTCFDGIQGGESNAPWIAAVFGDQNTLTAVTEALRTPATPRSITCTVNPRFESAPQGRFINAADCRDRNDADAVVSFLKARGFPNARLVYRDFRYR